MWIDVEQNQSTPGPVVEQDWKALATGTPRALVLTVVHRRSESSPDRDLGPLLVDVPRPDRPWSVFGLRGAVAPRRTLRSLVQFHPLSTVCRIPTRTHTTRHKFDGGLLATSYYHTKRGTSAVIAIAIAIAIAIVAARIINTEIA